MKKTRARIAWLAVVVLVSAVWTTPATAALFTDDFSSYTTKAQVEAVYTIEYSGGATTADWSLDAVNDEIDFDLESSESIFFYRVGKVEGATSGSKGTVTTVVSDIGAGDQGQHNHIGAKVIVDGSNNAWTGVWSGTQAQTNYRHTVGGTESGMGALFNNFTTLILEATGTSWDHRTGTHGGFWNTDPDTPFTMANGLTNKVGFFAECMSYNTASSGSVGSFSADIVPEPATMVLLGLGGIGLLIRRRRRQA